MDWTITPQESPRIVVVRTQGRWTLQGCRELLHQLAGAKEPLCPVLFDNRALNADGISAAELIAVDAMFDSFSASFSFARMAALVSPELRPTTEQWRRLTDCKSRGNVAVFTEEREAIEWLAGR